VFIAILDLRTAPADRADVHAHLASARPEVRALPGCIDYRVFSADHDASSLTVLHEWADEAAFAAYLRSDGFARSGATVRPRLTEPPVSRRYRAELVETVN
jgi:quinol monooxygenase YgiN